MKTFLFKLSVFVMTAFVLLNALLAVAGTLFVREGSEVFRAIRKAQLPSSDTGAVFGDSVSRQLLRHARLPGVLDLTTNQAVSICGQYLLVKLTLEHHPQVRRITMAYHPSCFANNLDGIYTFNYFVRPFYLRPLFQSSLDSLVRTRIDQRPVSRLMVLPMFRYTDLLGSTQYSESSQRTFFYISPVAADYLRRTATLCAEHHAELRIVPDPVSTTFGFNESVFRREVAAAHLDDLLGAYAASIHYVDPAELLDNLHFRKPYVEANSMPLVRMLLTPAGAGAGLEAPGKF